MARNQECKPVNGVVAVTEYSIIEPRNSVEALQAALSKQVVSIRLAASAPSFRNYQSGIYDDEACALYGISHAVNAVGYGQEAGQDYFIVRNSWSASWGEQGYIRIAAVNGPGICRMLEGPSSMPLTE